MKWSIEIFKCKMWPLLDFLAKFRYVLACLCWQFFYNYSHARILVKVFSVVPKFVNYALYNEDFWYRTKIDLFMVLNSCKDKKI